MFFDASSYESWLNELTRLEHTKNGKRDYNLLRIQNDSKYSIDGKVIDVIFKQEPIMYGGTSFSTYFYLLNEGKNKDLKKIKKEIGFRK